jgi:hypothetical protein
VGVKVFYTYWIWKRTGIVRSDVALFLGMDLVVGEGIDLGSHVGGALAGVLVGHRLLG